MQRLGNTIGEGHEPEPSKRFTDTGYGTLSGQGNVRSGAEDQNGTGYDKHHQVKTKFGRWPLAYDPVTGTASVDVTTSHYDFPAEGMDPFGYSGAVAMDASAQGLGDINCEAAGHASTAAVTEEKKSMKNKQKSENDDHDRGEARWSG